MEPAEYTGEPEFIDPWWGAFRVATGETLTRLIGPLRLSVERHPSEWRINAAQTSQGPDGPAADTPAETRRFVFSATRDPLLLSPVLADRPVVARPLDPLHVAAGQELSIYLSSPVWIRIEVGEPPALLQELPVVRPSDTWFGASTREGEFAYASRTAARLDFADVPKRPDRAVTAARIRNTADKTMLIERIALPVLHLAVFAAPDGLLCTQGVTIETRSETELSEITVEAGPPATIPDAVRLSAPREELQQAALVRAFSAIFH